MGNLNCQRDHMISLKRPITNYPLTTKINIELLYDALSLKWKHCQNSGREYNALVKSMGTGV